MEWFLDGVASCEPSSGGASGRTPAEKVSVEDERVGTRCCSFVWMCTSCCGEKNRERDGWVLFSASLAAARRKKAGKDNKPLHGQNRCGIRSYLAYPQLPLILRLLRCLQGGKKLGNLHLRNLLKAVGQGCLEGTNSTEQKVRYCCP